MYSFFLLLLLIGFPPPLAFSVLTWGRSAFACQASVSTGGGAAAATNMENGTEFPICKIIERYYMENIMILTDVEPIPYQIERKEDGGGGIH